MHACACTRKEGPTAATVAAVVATLTCKQPVCSVQVTRRCCWAPPRHEGRSRALRHCPLWQHGTLSIVRASLHWIPQSPQPPRPHRGSIRIEPTHLQIDGGVVGPTHPLVTPMQPLHGRPVFRQRSCAHERLQPASSGGALGPEICKLLQEAHPSSHAVLLTRELVSVQVQLTAELGRQVWQGRERPGELVSRNVDAD